MDDKKNILGEAAALSVQVLSEELYKEAAAIIKCDVPAIKTVEKVESNGNGYLGDGRLKILFEGHQFWRILVSRNFNVNALTENISNKNILYPKWDRTKYKGGTFEWQRLQLAEAIDKRSAYESASWGAFQIMGFNYKLCGFKDVFEMVEFMKVSAHNQLICFLKYVKAASLDRWLVTHNWAKFAYGYNGPGYRGNPLTLNDDYDIKLAKEYQNFVAAA